MKHIEVGSIDFLRDMAMLRVTYEGTSNSVDEVPKLSKDQLKEF